MNAGKGPKILQPSKRNILRLFKFSIDEEMKGKFVQFKRYILSRFGVSDRSGIRVRF